MSTESPKFNHAQDTFAVLFPRFDWSKLPKANIGNFFRLFPEYIRQLITSDQLDIASSTKQEFLLRVEISHFLDQFSLGQVLPNTFPSPVKPPHQKLKDLLKNGEVIGGCCQIENPDIQEIYAIGIIGQTNKPQAIVIYHPGQPSSSGKKEPELIFGKLNLEPVPIRI